MEADQRREADERKRQLEEQRRAFLVDMGDSYDEAERLAMFVSRLRQQGRTDQPPKVRAFLKWAGDHIRDLRAACSINEIEKDLAASGLFR
jgi:hypothetical protein